MPPSNTSGVFSYEFDVADSSIDANGHVNNVQFVQWMQEAAIRHADRTGCTTATRDAGATWVVRSHTIEYLRPAFAADRIQVVTWVANFRRAFSLREYEFRRSRDATLLARGRTDWVFIELKSWRPRSIPPSIAALFELPCDAASAGRWASNPP